MNHKNVEIESGFGPITDRLLNKICDIVTNRDFQEKFTDKLINPLTTIVNDKIKPYIYLTMIMYCILIILLIYIIYLLQSKK